MEISHFLKTGIELSNFSHTDSRVLSELSESFGVCVKRIEISEVFIDSVHWFLFRSSDEKNGGVSTLDGIFLGWWFIVWDAVSLFDISNRERNIQRWITFDWSYWSSLLNWSSFNWFWSGFNNWFGMSFWFSEVLIVSLWKFLRFFCELSSLNINELYVINLIYCIG